MDFSAMIGNFDQFLWGWPLIILFLAVSVIVMLALRFVQIRYFIDAWHMVFHPSKSEVQTEAKSEISPFQAFIAALGTATGNGSIAGIATGIYVGGPGTAFWMLVAGLVGMGLRFAEVYIATCFTGVHTFRGALGGPMVYLNRVPGKSFLPYVFAGMFLVYGLIGGNAMQANSMADAINYTWGINRWIIAACFLAFLLYASLGGAKRILHISDRLTPFKVAIFLICGIIVLIGNYHAILPSIVLIIKSAFTCQAAMGGVVGWTIQVAMKEGLVRSLTMSEAGLGSAALAFGATGSKKPVQDSLLSMVPVFISTFVVGLLVALCVVSSGVWNNGEQAIRLTIAAFGTVFSCYAGWIVTFISASFGLGCMAAVLFIAMRSWLFLTNNRFVWGYYILFCAAAFLGAIAKVGVIWSLVDIIVGLMLLINLYAIIWLLPTVLRGLRSHEEHKG